MRSAVGVGPVDDCVGGRMARGPLRSVGGTREIWGACEVVDEQEPAAAENPRRCGQASRERVGDIIRVANLQAQLRTLGHGGNVFPDAVQVAS